MIMPAKIAELRELSDELQQEFAGITARFETICADSMIDIRQDPGENPKLIGNEILSLYSMTSN
jgi:hypothetical protein